MKKGKINLGLVALVIAVLAAILAAAALLSQAPQPIEHEFTVTLNILEIPDFALDVSPTTINAPAGSTPAFNITITPNSSFAGQVDLSIENLPAGITATWFPSSTVTVGGAPAGVQLNLQIPLDNALVGAHSLKIKAASTNYNSEP